MSGPKTILITGASSGFGLVTARKLAGAGHRVFGTSRNPSGCEADGFALLPLDVTSDESVSECITSLRERVGRIDVLVNNAGLAQDSLVEETPLEQARPVFETNFWGVVRLTNAVLPWMREQGSGLIVNVSSLAGLVGTPGQGFYAASKHALEGYTEALRAELTGQSIRIVLVEPGFFQTNLHSSMVRRSNQIAAYDGLRQRVSNRLERSFTDGGDPEQVAEMIQHVIGENARRFRYLVGSDAHTTHRLRKWLPEAWFQNGLRRKFGIG